MTYTIGEVAALTGVPAMTLRAWESRYGVVHPSRTTSSYRQYDEHDLEVLQRMRVLVDSGVPARRAAELAIAPTQSASHRHETHSVPLFRDHTALAQAGIALDSEAVRRILDEAFAVATIETAVDDWLVPSLREVGRLWQADELDVASEHFISAAVMRKLSALFDATPAHGPRVIVGLPTAARHELPALAFALLLQRTGTQVLYVGADVPQPGWARLAKVWKPRAAVLGVACDQDVAPGACAVRALIESRVDLVYVGGHAAQQVSEAIVLPSSLSMAADTVANALTHRRRTGAAARGPHPLVD